jgi:hypothetical protein
MKPFVVFVVPVPAGERLASGLSFSSARYVLLKIVETVSGNQQQAAAQSHPFWTWFTENPRPHQARKFEPNR